MKTHLRVPLGLRKLSRISMLALGAALVNAFTFAADDAPPADKSDADKKPEQKTEQKSDEKSEAKADQKSESSTTTTDYRNWFDVSVGGTIVSGDKAAYQQRYGLPSGPFGGVEDFHYEEDIGKKGIFKVDGRGIFDNHDYSLKFDVEHPDIGFIRGGYEQYRDYTDGYGGFFPATGAWVTPFDNNLALDHGKAFFEAGLTLPNKPTVTFRYNHEFRNGQEDSTSWGDLDIPGYGDRKIVPSFWDINERSDSFALDAQHTLGSTTFGLGMRYEISTTDDALNVLRNPGEANARYGTDRERVDMDLFNVHAFSDTRFNDKIQFTSGYSYTTLTTDLSGYRVYGATYDPTFAQRLPIADTFENLTGGSDLQQHVANLNLPIQITDSLLLVPSLRIEAENTDSSAQYSSPSAPLSGFPYGAISDQGLLDVTERLDLRYTGITNWVFYVRGEWLEGSGDLTERWDNLGTGANIAQAGTDNRRYWQTYTVGANWYPLRKLNFGAEYYHKDRWNDYNINSDSTVNVLTSIPTSVYPAFLTAQNWTTDDTNFRVTWRPVANLTLVGRYDFQRSTIDTKPDSSSGLSETQSAEMTSHIISGTLSWTPLQRLYLQAGVNYVLDQTDTPAQDLSPAIQAAANDYWTATASAGYALDKKTDLQFQYMYYRANDRQDNSAFGLPYGADAQEQSATAAIIRRITERMRITLKYGYFVGEDWTSGTHNDYQAHLIYSSLHYRF
jgi:hypothetical protein